MTSTIILLVCQHPLPRSATRRTWLRLFETPTRNRRKLRELSEKFQKNFPTQKLKNLLRKLDAPDSARETFENFLDKVVEEGGIIEYKTDDDGVISTIYLASQTMINAFTLTDPPLIQVDTSFGVDSARYKIAAFCYLNLTTNKSEIGSLAYTADETAGSLDFIFENFRKICVTPRKVFIVDKDFTQLASVRRNFPDAIILLCQLHAIKFMRTLISSGTITIEQKNELVQLFKSTLYAHDEDAFNEASKKFIDVCEADNIQVRVKDTYKPLADYYVNNWQSCKEMWAKCFRKEIPILGDNTTNRIERTFGSIKTSLKDRFPRLPNTTESIMHVMKFADDRLRDRYNYTSVKSLRIYDSNERIQSMNDDASKVLNDRGCVVFHLAQKLLEKHRARLLMDDNGVQHILDENNSKIYATTSTSCMCSYFSQNEAPCMHILIYREENDETFTKNIFHSRYHKTDAREDINFPLHEADDSTFVGSDDDMMTDVVENIDSLDEKEKYRIVTPILLTISSVVSLHSTRQFLQYIEELKEVEDRIREGKSILLSSNSEKETPATSETPETQQGSPTSTNQFAVPDSSGNPIDDVPPVVTSTITQPITQPACSSSKHSNLKFKKKVNAKGRPRVPKKQHSFKKTKFDRVQQEELAW